MSVTNKIQSYEKGTKLQKRYKITKKVRSYEKGTPLRKRYEVTKQVRWMSINLGQFVFYCFSTFCQLDVFFSNTVLKSNKRFFFEYRKYFIQLRTWYEAPKKVRRGYEISYERPWL
jgi:hypothetical protein